MASDPRIHAAMCLEGHIAMPSRQMLYPTTYLDGVNQLYGCHWRQDLDLSSLGETRSEFRDRALTPAEQRVALPWEIREARRPGQFAYWVHIWAWRVAAEEGREAEQPVRPARPLHSGWSSWWSDSTASSSCSTSLCSRQTSTPQTPPQVAHQHTLDLAREQYRHCSCGGADMCEQCAEAFAHGPTNWL